MSVAFRRDGDEEHLEPRFEVPIPPGPNLVTDSGLTLIRSRLKALQQKLETLDDEGAIASAKRDLRYWQSRLATADIQPKPEGSLVQFGSTVRFGLAGKQRAVTIVGHDEAEPATGRLSFTAPLARALLGAEAGDVVDFNGQEAAIQIVAVINGAP